MTAIIVLNWNGWQDTIACLQSLYRLDTDEFVVIVADNGSTNGSVEQISEHLSKSNICYYGLQKGESLEQPLMKKDCVIYSLNNNYGFAKGNNLAVKFVRESLNPDYYLMLNNDTEVFPDFLSELTRFISLHMEYKALTPMIRYYNPSNKIWNCGGRLFGGFRKYYYADKDIIEVKEKGYISISIITGCALFFPKEMIAGGNLLTEKFFFGEEDFEFSMRMKRKKYKMACVLTSQIYHKVSASTVCMNMLPRIYIHYLNRFIDIRQNFSRVQFGLWRMVYSIYIRRLLFKHGFSKEDINTFFKLLMKNCKVMNGVSQDYFTYVVSHKIDEIE